MARDPKLRRFAGAQVPRLVSLMALSREITGEHFRLGQQEVDALPVEVRTLVHLDSHEIHPRGVLADIARYQYAEPRLGRKRDLYRINLQDHNILSALQNNDNHLRFSPLLLYVLTHELIHIVRFVKFLVPFHSAHPDRDQEERTVHELTCNLLGRVPMRGLERVVNYYRSLAGNRNQ